MSKPRLLDLFCGGGGAGMGYSRAGFDVVGVDINPQSHYPFDFVQSDWESALHMLAGDFDAIHASPPCQSYTRKTPTWGRARVNVIEHHDLLGRTREALEALDMPYVIENVVGAPIQAQLLLCGTMFGLRIIKHRLFEANWPMPMAPATCDHSDVYNPWSGKGRTAQQLRDAQDTQWLPMHGGASRKNGYTGDLDNAIPPAYTEHIGRYLLERASQLELTA